MNWQNITIQELNEYCKNTMNTALGIEFTEIGEDFLKATMPVNINTIQPLRMLNGGASLALCEIVGSMAANLHLDREKYVALGLDVNGNHLKPVMEGDTVTATATPFHIGKTTHVWQVKIENREGKLIFIGRITMTVVEKIK